jgi:hypothetical protein
MADEHWAELQDQAARFGPRYDRGYGTCPSCDLGPSMMVPLSGIAWAVCGLCNYRWVVGTDLFDLPPIDDETYAFCMEMLADADEAPGDLRHHHKGLSPMKKAMAPVAGDGSLTSAELAPIISDDDLRTRSIAKFELFEFAARLGWPAVSLPSHLTTIASGEHAWRGAPLAIASTRRTVWNQLVELAHHTTALKER